MRLVGIRLLCDGEREKIQKTTGGILPFIPSRVVLVHHALQSYSVGMLARTQADVRKWMQTDDRVDAEQRG